MNSFLDISRANQLRNKKDRLLYRFLEMIPGILSWGTLALALIFSWILPAVVAVFIIVFDFFWLIRVLYLAVHQLAGYKKMKENMKKDWIGELEKLPLRKWDGIYHIVVLPMYKEGFEIVDSTLKSILNSNYPKNRIMVVLALEERAKEFSIATAKRIQEKHDKEFSKMMITVHPQNIPGEMSGKGSNVAYALKEVQKEVNKLGIPYENIIVSNFDVDTKPYPEYFGILTWNFLTAENPLRSSYQPIPIYNNNVWEVPAFSRVIATSNTFWQMMQQERPEQLVSYSSHAIPFKTLMEVGYPSNIVSDDSRIFWKSYMFYDGDYRMVPLYYPVSMDAVLAENIWKTAFNQYRQQRRWAWGCVEIPYLLFHFLKNKKIPGDEKIRHSYVILDGFWSWATSALIIFFLGWLPLMLGGMEFQTSMLSYNLPKVTSYIMTAAMAGMLVSAGLSLLTLPPKPKRLSKLKNLSVVLQWFLLPVTLILFGTFPSLDAQLRLILGKHLGFWVTEKYRKGE
jgi:cellulose synthase/poly-beta-1,6-N-acetylglucosamine synthase-like glycosyltransferase